MALSQNGLSHNGGRSNSALRRAAGSHVERRIPDGPIQLGHFTFEEHYGITLREGMLDVVPEVAPLRSDEVEVTPVEGFPIPKARTRVFLTRTRRPSATRATLSRSRSTTAFLDDLRELVAVLARQWVQSGFLSPATTRSRVPWNVTHADVPACQSPHHAERSVSRASQPFATCQSDLMTAKSRCRVSERECMVIDGDRFWNRGSTRAEQRRVR